ncbi:MAG: DUF5320 domain-containing protein [Candidatus Theseobacter exili]|nr:DUF5320 domain-containing protein [Candidatus Theseobacter exili]
MPGGDRTGPGGEGPMTGRGLGEGGERGRIAGKRPGAVTRGYCVCPGCGGKVSHQLGEPCSSVSCPECGTRMVRE